ncbi:MAG: glycosyl hydrolase [Planctomycetaceae bacterium]|nr:glycosyl hydrolase [Planctomycetaceae bacterium]
MYQDAVSHHKTMGDVDVIYHDGVYHLFHLVLPNHDFIAHAISRDGINWKRIDNAIFIGNPGKWDDHMLWTMHVTPDPWKPGRWRMFYTGLSRCDGGNIQRVGCAYSEDLIHWEKAPDRWEECHDDKKNSGGESSEKPCPFPIEAKAPHYEASLDEGRHWISFRDPFFFQEGEYRCLLVAARVPTGPIIRRGCVALYEEKEPCHFVERHALHQPGLYDDIEVPNLFKFGDRYYLVASIREDAKVRYWYSDNVDGPWANFFDNVLLPQGNYAARFCFDEKGLLVWNFFHSETDRTVKNLMPPPKRIVTREDGRLGAVSFEGFDKLVESTCHFDDLLPLSPLMDNKHAECHVDREAQELQLSSEAGFEGFVVSEKVRCFRLRATLSLDGLGKCGLLFRTDAETTSGYQISLDLQKGIAQCRAWGRKPHGTRENAFDFKPLQAGYWQNCGADDLEFSLVAMQSYIELSLGGYVLLTLSDETYTSGRVGLYVESSCLKVSNLKLEHFHPPRTADWPELET